jgi:hypothetical protein
MISTGIGPLIFLEIRSRLLRKSANLEGVTSPTIHILHTHTNLHIDHKGSIEGDDVRRATVVHNLQLPQNLFSHCSFLLNMNHLPSAKCQAFENFAFFAMMVFVGICITLLTVPPFPAPNFSIVLRSSARKSSLNSTPSSKVAICSLKSPTIESGRIVSSTL